MLFAAEGGGFFSAAASGYSKGVTVLLLGQKNNEDKRMRVSSWSQYELVDQEPNTDLRLASLKNRLSRGCASLICFGRSSTGLDSQTRLKVGPAKQSGSSSSSLDPDQGEDLTYYAEDNSDNAKKCSLKSSLKKQPSDIPIHVEEPDQHGISGHTDRRKVQWTDACGIELAEIREFEPSEMGGSDDECQNGSGKGCACTIM